MTAYLREALFRAQHTTEAQRRAQLGYPKDAESLDSINARFAEAARWKKSPEGRAYHEGWQRYYRELEAKEEQKAIDALIVWAAGQQERRD